MRHRTMLLALAAGLMAAAAASAAPPTPAYAFTNGRWWSGAEYVATTMYTTDGVLKTAPPSRIDETIDLGGRYVIPPLIDGHNHWLEPGKVAEYSACYLADGVFYVRDMANMPWVVNQIRDHVNLPTSVDFETALQGFTGPGAHPAEIMDFLVKAGMYPQSFQRPYDPDAFFVVQSEHDIDTRFKLLLTEHPAYVKAFLSFSELHQQRENDPAMYGNHRGMDPKLLPHLVKLAHAAYLRVAVHIYTAADFRTAVQAGADDIAHLPGAAPEPQLGPSTYLLTAADAELARRHRVTVTTTIHDVIGGEGEENADMWRAHRDNVIIPNLKLLKAHGVPLLVGSDHFRHSSLAEIFALASLGVFTNAEILKMDTEATVERAFPGRKLAHLRNGYEANFLVLDRDPIESLDNLKSIYLRVKEGRHLTLPEAALHRSSLACIQ